MSPLWNFFWPMACAGMLCGLVGGILAFRGRRRAAGRLAGPGDLLRERRRRFATAVVGFGLLSIAAAVSWQAPLGAADRLSSAIEHRARVTLDYYELPEVRATLFRAPLRRSIALSGPADDFQRSELVRIMGDIPGASTASWSGSPPGLPLILESMLAALIGFGVGLLLAYLVELHRRANANWRW